MEPFPVIVSALVLAFANFIGILMPIESSVPRKWWLSFSGGVAVAYVFIHLIPELHKITGVAGDPLTFSLALLGTITYFGTANLLSSQRVPVILAVYSYFK